MSMTVAELIEKLKDMPQEAIVVTDDAMDIDLVTYEQIDGESCVVLTAEP